MFNSTTGDLTWSVCIAGYEVVEGGEEKNVPDAHLGTNFVGQRCNKPIF